MARFCYVRYCTLSEVLTTGGVKQMGRTVDHKMVAVQGSPCATTPLILIPGILIQRMFCTEMHTVKYDTQWTWLLELMAFKINTNGTVNQKLPHNCGCTARHLISPLNNSWTKRNRWVVCGGRILPPPASFRERVVLVTMRSDMFPRREKHASWMYTVGEKLIIHGEVFARTIHTSPSFQRI
jgi:hypothetical protein